MINYISCNYLIQTIEQFKKTPITRGIPLKESKGELRDLLPTNTVTPLALVICYNI
jgi:hypothetical protein